MTIKITVNVNEVWRRFYSKLDNQLVNFVQLALQNECLTGVIKY